MTRQQPRGQRVKLERDPVPALMIHVPMDLRYSNPTLALRQLSYTAAQKDLPDPSGIDLWAASRKG